MDEDLSVIARAYGIAYRRDGTESLTELTWLADGGSRIAVVHLQRYRP